MASKLTFDLRDDVYREFNPGFQPLCPRVRYAKRARIAYDNNLNASRGPPELLCTGFCRNPASLEQWEQITTCRYAGSMCIPCTPGRSTLTFFKVASRYRSLESAAGQARQSNAMPAYPSIPQELLEQLLQESLTPSVLQTRRNMQGCRIATWVMETCTVVVTTGGGRGDALPSLLSCEFEMCRLYCQVCPTVVFLVQAICWW
jgi:hypothetical protein